MSFARTSTTNGIWRTWKNCKASQKCNCSVSSQVGESGITVPALLLTEALCVTMLLFEERNKLFTTRIYFLLVRNRLASYEKLVFVKTADWR